jgi:short-subunit dehydrogenase
LAIVTGASAGIGYELAKIFAENGFDLVIAADQPKITDAADEFRRLGAKVEAVEADLATLDGVDALYAAVKDRPVEALLANAGHGLGKGFLDQDFGQVRHVIDTNVTGTIYLIQKVGRDMRARGTGRILIVGSEGGFIPGAFHAVYNGSKAFIDSFSLALRAELKGSGVTVTCLMPGPTETEFFERADMMDTKVGQSSKDDPAVVARTGFNAMMRGDGDVVSGWTNKLRTSIATVTPAGLLAEQHRKLAEPGYKKSDGSGIALPAFVIGASALMVFGWLAAREMSAHRGPRGRRWRSNARA